MAKPNYKFEKRQKDLARQKKKEEKLQRKALKAETEEPETEGLEPGAEASPEPADSESKGGPQ